MRKKRIQVAWEPLEFMQYDTDKWIPIAAIVAILSVTGAFIWGVLYGSC